MEKDEIEARVLNAKRKPRLEWYEREIEKRGKAFADILRELRDDPLKPYLATHDSLAHYLEDRWSMTPRRQQQLTAAENVKQMLSDAAPDLAPIVQNMKEGQVRELAKVPEPERPAVLRAAIADPKGKLTGTVIKRAHAKVIDAATGQPEQQEFSFTFKTTPEHREDAEWFLSITADERDAIIAKARWEQDTNARKTTT